MSNLIFWRDLMIGYMKIGFIVGLLCFIYFRIKAWKSGLKDLKEIKT